MTGRKHSEETKKKMSEAIRSNSKKPRMVNELNT
jgi:hypothetical protein